MPKITYLKSTIPPANGVQELFRRYIKAIGGPEAARRIGVNYGTMRNKLSRGEWNNSEIRTWCEALGISANEIGAAMLYK